MTFSIARTVIIAGLAMAAGWLAFHGRGLAQGAVAAALVCSLCINLLVTALIGAIAGAFGLSFPSYLLVGVSIATAMVAGLARKETWPSFRMDWPEWQGLIVGLVLVAYGLFSITTAINETSDGTLQVHSWYNADWFKHMGHVHALSNFGVPARDSFGGAGPLHYYWLFYTLPGAAGSLGAEPWAALSASNAVISLLLGYILYSLVRTVVASPTFAMVLTIAGMVVLAPAGFLLFFLQGHTLELFLQSGIAPAASGLLATGQVEPQHALACALFGSWLVLSRSSLGDHGVQLPRYHRAIALVALSSMMTISTMLGSMFLMAYGLTRLWFDRMRAVPELIVMVIASCSVVVILQVLNIGSPGSAIESPLLTDEELPLPGWQLAAMALSKLTGFVGLPLLVIVPFLLRYKPATTRARYTLTVGFALILAGVFVVAASQMTLPARVGSEIFVRAKLPLSIAVLMIGALLVQHYWDRSQKEKRWIVAIFAGLAIWSVPSIYAFLIWQSNFGDVFTTEIPKDDRLALAQLRAASEPTDLVWQYPEKPMLGDPAGGDNWSVVLAGRAVPNSERATDYAAAAPAIEASEKWFAGEDVLLPDAIDWVYLSRVLHPETYDDLVLLMRQDRGFREGACYPNACIFGRSSSMER